MCAFVQKKCTNDVSADYNNSEIPSDESILSQQLWIRIYID